MMINISEAIVSLKRDEVIEAVKKRAEAGEDPFKIIEECRQGMKMVGDLYTKGEYFLSELMLSGEIFKKTFAILEPYLAKAIPSEALGKVIIATLKGDIHDLGKNIVVTLLRAQRFEVHDIGVDVDPKVIVGKVEEIRPQFVGFSCLMTTALEVMKQTAGMLVTSGLREHFKLMIGGGVTTPFAKEYIGADFQTVDAMEGVNYCVHTIGGK
jgi:methanogenic corrinoid protein MtbC1